MSENTSPVVAALPGDGWTVVYKDYDRDGAETFYPVVALHVHADGATVPAVLMDGGGDIVAHPLGPTDDNGFAELLRTADLHVTSKAA